MKRVLSLIFLLLTVSAAQAQEEQLVPLHFDIVRDDICKVFISMVQNEGTPPETYSIVPQTGRFAPGEHFTMVKPEHYESISTLCITAFDVYFTRDTTGLFNLEKDSSVHLGDISSGKGYIHYDLQRIKPIKGLQNMFMGTRYPKFLSKATGYSETTFNRIFKSLVNIAYAPVKDKTVYTYNFNYTSADVDGNPVTLSAKLYLPDKEFTDGDKLRGLILNNCMTLTKEDEAPTNAEQVESIMAWYDYAVVMPDCYGFGASASRPQSFINTQLVGKNNIDAVLAARQLIEDLNVPCEDMLVNGGYSMGATAGIAAQKYASGHPEEGIVFNKTFLGGGAYDFNLCYDIFLSGAYPEAGRFIILSAIGLNETEKLGIDYAKVFKEPLLSNYKEWILSKKYDIYEIMDFMGHPTSVSDYLTDGIVNKTSPEFTTFSKAMAAHKLTDGITIPDGTEMYILHSTNDNFVPYENFIQLQQSLAGKNLHFISGKYGNHIKSSLKVSNLLMKSLK